MFSIDFYISNEEEMGLVGTYCIFIFLFISLGVITYYKYESVKNKKYKRLIDVFLYIVTVFTIFIILGIIAVSLSYIFRNGFNFEQSGLITCLTTIVFPVTLYSLLFISIDDIFHKEDKVSFILTIILSISLILLFINYNFNSMFNRINDLYSANDIYRYMVQNFAYFAILNIGLLTYRIIYKNHTK